MNTARQIIDSEISAWIDRTEIQQFSEAQRLEEVIGMWEYGKWCCRDTGRLGYKAQIKFRGSRPESTAWDAIRDISDDEGMRIHDATVGLSPLQLDVLDRVYVKWQVVSDAVKAMRMGNKRFYELRITALRTIAERLQ